ncbi:uncharacterized protein JCM15063_001354 [Sporobolomyces koalae]|uniref:uncharacterized protein n=1 Tax=Sporobolomyces koalae TaxID=500713 RepID=UPI003172111A
MSAISQKRAAFQVLQFLKDSLPSLKQDDQEGIEVASQCIAEAFGVDLDKSEDQRAYSIAPQTLSSLLEQHVSSAASQPAAASAPKEASADDKAAAEQAKSKGNQLMAQKDYQGAIEAYGQAIEKDGQNAVYWSNRAAAYSQVSNFDSAISDARKALEIDPSFSKAYSRLGHALFSNKEYAEAVEAYEKGLELDPNNATMKSSLATARSRAPAAATEESSVSRGASPAAGAGAGGNPLAGLAGLMGGGGAGGAGGMPGLADIMNNPAIMGMAQQMMQNGGMERLMNNDSMRRMMESMQGGGGMPDMASLMADPEMRRMAESFGSMMGGPPGGAGRSGLVASHTVEKLLALGYKVRGTTRTASKLDNLKRKWDEKYPGQFEVAEIKDIMRDGAYDQAIQGVAGFAHVASNVSFSTNYDEVVNDAVNSTLVALRAAHATPSVKRFVLTSSVVAVVIPEAQTEKGVRVGPEDYNHKTIELAKSVPDDDPKKGAYVYGASKTEGELAAWKFVKENKPSFEFSAVQPAFCIGKILDAESQAGSTAGFLRDTFTGKNDNAIKLVPDVTFVPVSDIAALHAGALVLSSVKQQRLIAGPYTKSWNDILAIFREKYPNKTFFEDVKDPHPAYEIFDNSAALHVLKELGQSGWTPFEQAISENVTPFA